MKYVALMALFAAICFGGEVQKPVCSARNQGQFWPAEANFSHQAARQLYQSGELEMCSLAVWKYRWELISVNARVLTRKAAAGRRERHAAADEPKPTPTGKP
ncbi:MAG: hypothetical protein LAP87_04805 [Acidobacteriia bacterium]|nr:hypothetical protein [Terriglobia bacterium]